MHSPALENDVRLFVYKHFVTNGQAPTLVETARSFDLGTKEIRGMFNNLAEKHVLVLRPDSHEIWMAMPFSAISTAFRVIQGESAWWAN